jgi:hypothetical protein
VQAKSRSLLVAVLVTSVIALLDAWTGDRASRLGLLITAEPPAGKRSLKLGVVELSTVPRPRPPSCGS